MKTQETMFTVDVWDVKFDVPIQYTKAYPAFFDYDQPPEQAEFDILGVFLKDDDWNDLYAFLSQEVINKIEEKVKEQFIDFINE